MAKVREEARESAVLAIRSLEDALVEALGGEKLLGLPNLASSKLPWRGARVRGGAGKRLSTQYFGKGGGWSRPVLCVEETGHVVLVSRSRSGEISTRQAMDDELIAEDVAHLAELLPTIIETHIKRAEARRETFARLRALSTRIKAATGDDYE
jgi:hypothetical protein